MRVTPTTTVSLQRLHAERGRQLLGPPAVPPTRPAVIEGRLRPRPIRGLARDDLVDEDAERRRPLTEIQQRAGGGRHLEWRARLLGAESVRDALDDGIAQLAERTDA